MAFTREKGAKQSSPGVCPFHYSHKCSGGECVPWSSKAGYSEQ